MSSLFPPHSVEIARLSSGEPADIKRETLDRDHLRERQSVSRRISGQRDIVANLVRHSIAEQSGRSVEDLQLVVVEEFAVQPAGTAATLRSELVIESHSGALSELEITRLRAAAHSVIKQLQPQADQTAAGAAAGESTPGIDSYIQRKLERDLRPDIDAVDEHLALLVGRKVVQPMLIQVPGCTPFKLSGVFVSAQETARPAELIELQGVVIGVGMVAGKKQLLRLAMECIDPASPAAKPYKVHVEYKAAVHESVVWPLLLKQLGRRTTMRVEVSRKRNTTGKWTATHSLIEVVDANLRLAA